MVDLDELERLEKVATPGEWGEPWPTQHPGMVYDGGINAPDKWGLLVAACDRNPADGTFIAALRNAAPELIALARVGLGQMRISKETFFSMEKQIQATLEENQRLRELLKRAHSTISGLKVRGYDTGLQAAVGQTLNDLTAALADGGE